MLFSIIVPVYNVELYLEECVNSILSQTYIDFEIVLVNDGSTDSSGNICEKYSLIDKRVKVIHKENGGLSSAWVEGLKYVTGEYICSIDSDDYIENNLLEELKKYIEQYHSDIYIYGYKSANSNYYINNTIKAHSGFYEKKKIEKYILPELINVGNLSSRSCIYLSRINKVIKRDLLIKNTKYYRTDISYGEDNMWTIPNMLTADSIYVFENYYPYCYRHNPQSITQSYNKGLWEKFIILDNQILHIIKSLGYPELEVQVLRDCVFHAIMAINNEIFSNLPRNEIVKKISIIINNQRVMAGLLLMRQDKCKFREKIILLLLKIHNAQFIYAFKQLRRKTRKYIK